jgi:chromosome segregation ATPase
MSRRIELANLSACFLLLLLAAGFVSQLHAQDPNDPLTEDEVQQIRDNKTNPNERIQLYIRFIDGRLDAIKALSGKGKSENEKAEVRARLEEFTRLCDELQDNLDTYDEAHADIRKSLKELVAATAKWPQALNAAGSDPSYDFSHKTALEAARSATDEARQMSISQDVYFDVHKKQRNGNGNGPS